MAPNERIVEVRSIQAMEVDVNKIDECRRALQRLSEAACCVDCDAPATFRGLDDPEHPEMLCDRHISQHLSREELPQAQEIRTFWEQLEEAFFESHS